MTPELGWRLLLLVGLILLLSGAFAVVLAGTVKLLPNDIESLGMSITELCTYADCRIVSFMEHDRLAMGGSFMAIGVLYMWLAGCPLRAREPWAWWTLAISGGVGFTSFLTYLGYGYLDWIHGIATLMLLAVYLAGMALARSALRGPRNLKAVVLDRRERPGRDRIGAGRAGFLFLALGLIGAGLTIVVVGITTVFVPQDLDFMRLSSAQIDAINPRLVPVIAHDRAEFGGGLVSFGIALLAVAWYGTRPGGRALWWALAVAGTALWAGAIASHPVIGYTDFFHLAPAYLGALGWAALLAVLRRPLADERRTPLVGAPAE